MVVRYTYCFVVEKYIEFSLCNGNLYTHDPPAPLKISETTAFQISRRRATEYSSLRLIRIAL